MKKQITVFTPTYNRAHTLPRLYQSLCEQEFTDFEWLVVDDGSVDNTRELIDGYLKENRIAIKYVSQPNGGKHRAINRGVGQAEGYLFMIVDSDDYLTHTKVLGSIADQISFLRASSDFCGVVGNKVFEDDTVIGTTIGDDILDTTFIDYREKYKVKGDREEVIKLEVMRAFPFPETPGENFCPEGLIWNRMATKYKARYINQPYLTCEYLPGGLSDNIKRLRQNSPRAFMNYYGEYLRHKIPFRSKIKAAISYWAVFFKSEISFRQACRTMGFYIFFLPLGWLLHNGRRL